MKTKKVKKFIVVQEATAEEFERVLNEKLQSIEDDKPEITFNMNEGHCVYIQYTETIRIPESFKEECEISGICLFCGDCSHFNPELKHGCDRAKGGNGRAKARDVGCSVVYEEHAERKEVRVRGQTRVA